MATVTKHLGEKYKPTRNLKVSNKTYQLLQMQADKSGYEVGHIADMIIQYNFDLAIRNRRKNVQRLEQETGKQK